MPCGFVLAVVYLYVYSFNHLAKVCNIQRIILGI